ncbi:MAG: calcium/sodium antiporter [archaeon]
MVALLIWIIVFIASLLVLIKASDYFTDSAEIIGLHFGMSEFLVGVTIVALGTSIPELATSIVSIFKGASEIVIGNVIGSNIANVLLILGICAIIYGKLIIETDIKTLTKYLLAISAILLFIATLGGIINTWKACVLLGLYILYVIHIVYTHNDVNKATRPHLNWKPVVILLASTVFIYFSAEYVIRSVIGISEILGLGKEVIAASAVAFGTSLPELTVSLTAVKKKKFDMAVGNIIGSNLFNTLVVIGIPGLFASLTVTAVMGTLGIGVMLLATVILLVFMYNKKISRLEGIIMVILYLLFIAKLFGAF